MSQQNPHLIEPADLAPQLSDNLLIIDLCKESQYRSAHIPGALHVAAAELMCGQPPVPNKLPGKQQLDALFSRLGLTPETTVIIYDDEGGGWAGRMAWTLDVIGHDKWCYLNGGLIAWSREGYPLTEQIPQRTPVNQQVNIEAQPIAELEDILDNLDTPNFLVWDARSLEEYEGSRAVSQRPGHIPGAIHCEWTSLMDTNKNYRIRSDAYEYLAALGLTPDHHIVTHCQGHHRSGFTYLVARILGYPSIKGYHGSWAEWGNHPDTPVVVGND